MQLTKNTQKTLLTLVMLLALVKTHYRLHQSAAVNMKFDIEEGNRSVYAFFNNYQTKTYSDPRLFSFSWNGSLNSFALNAPNELQDEPDYNVPVNPKGAVIQLAIVSDEEPGYLLKFNAVSLSEAATAQALQDGIPLMEQCFGEASARNIGNLQLYPGSLKKIGTIEKKAGLDHFSGPLTVPNQMDYTVYDEEVQKIDKIKEAMKANAQLKFTQFSKVDVREQNDNFYILIQISESGADFKRII